MGMCATASGSARRRFTAIRRRPPSSRCCDFQNVRSHRKDRSETRSTVRGYRHVLVQKHGCVRFQSHKPTAHHIDDTPCSCMPWLIPVSRRIASEPDHNDRGPSIISVSTTLESSLHRHLAQHNEHHAYMGTWRMNFRAPSQGDRSSIRLKA